MQVDITSQIDEILVSSEEMHILVVVVVDGNPSETRKACRCFLLLHELLKELSELLFSELLFRPVLRPVLEVIVPHLCLDPGVICVAWVIMVAAVYRSASSPLIVVAKETLVLTIDKVFTALSSGDLK